MTPSDPESIKKFLQRTPVFAGIEDPALSKLLAMLTERSFPSGEIVYREGDAGHEVFIIRSGTVEVVRTTKAGHDVVLGRMGVGDIFGDMTLIDMQARSATVRTTADTVTYVLANRELYKLYREEVRAFVILGQNILRELCRRLRRADARICELTDEVEELKSSAKHA